MIVISGGTAGKSKEVGLSNSFNIFLFCLENGKLSSFWARCGGGDPGNSNVGGVWWVGDGVCTVKVGIINEAGRFRSLSISRRGLLPNGGGRF